MFPPVLRTSSWRAALVLPLSLLASSCAPGEQPPPSGQELAEETAPPPRPAIDPDTAGAYPVEGLSARPKLTDLREVTQAYRALYPPLLLEAGVGGSSVVRVVVDDRGTPVDVTLERPSGHQQLDEASIRLARRMRFSPGECAGEAVRAHLPMPVTWSPAMARLPQPDSAAALRDDREWEGGGSAEPVAGTCEPGHPPARGRAAPPAPGKAR